jgi:hypothetical protein
MEGHAVAAEPACEQSTADDVRQMMRQWVHSLPLCAQSESLRYGTKHRSIARVWSLVHRTQSSIRSFFAAAAGAVRMIAAELLAEALLRIAPH